MLAIFMSSGTYAELKTLSFETEVSPAVTKWCGLEEFGQTDSNLSVKGSIVIDAYADPIEMSEMHSVYENSIVTINLDLLSNGVLVDTFIGNDLYYGLNQTQLHNFNYNSLVLSDVFSWYEAWQYPIAGADSTWGLNYFQIETITYRDDKLTQIADYEPSIGTDTQRQIVTLRFQAPDAGCSTDVRTSITFDLKNAGYNNEHSEIGELVLRIEDITYLINQYTSRIRQLVEQIRTKLN